MSAPASPGSAATHPHSAAARPHLGVHEIGWSVGAAPILSGASLTVERGEIVGLLGPNGSGKSTLLRIAARLLAPDHGTARLDGDDVRSLPRRSLARRLAFVEQQSTAVVDVTVLDVALLGRIPHAGPLAATTDDDHARARAALARVGIDHLSDRRWSTLSGGERQRAQLARALAQDPELLLLDEPTNHLDIGHQLQFLNLVRETAVTTLVALHDLNLAAEYCHRVVLLDGGRVVAAGPTAEVLTAGTIAAVFGVDALVETHPRTGRPLVIFNA